MAEDEDIQDAEIVMSPTTALVPANLFGTDDPMKVLEKAVAIATPLANLVEDRGLFMQIRGRRHVYVEGWTLLGAMLGCSPILRWSRQVTDEEGRWAPPVTHVEYEDGTRSDGSTYKVRKVVIDTPGHGGWEARVEIVRHGEVISAGEMECRWEEDSWQTRDSYAVRSMAQTRATSKAGRGALSFVMSLAGFDVTPAEEMSRDMEETGEETDPNVYVPQAYCPSCRGTKIIDRSKDESRGKKPVYACANPKCTGGAEKKDGGRWPWATYHRDDLHFMVKESREEERPVRQEATRPAPEVPTSFDVSDAESDAFSRAAEAAHTKLGTATVALISSQVEDLFGLMHAAELWPEDALDKALDKAGAAEISKIGRKDEIIAWAERIFKFARATIAKAIQEERDARQPDQPTLESGKTGPF